MEDKYCSCCCCVEGFLINLCCFPFDCRNRFDWKEQNCDLKSRRVVEGTNFEDDLASLEISNI